MKAARILFPVSLLIGTSALAQEAAPSPEQPTAADLQTTAVTDDEVSRFARAALIVEEIAGKAEIDQQQKQAAMAAAVKASGFEPRRFNDIARASQSDAALQERIRMAATQQVEAAPPSR
jgi:hypothetical protein